MDRYKARLFTKNRLGVTCDFCGKTTAGGIIRVKGHQTGVRGNVGAYNKIPLEIKLLIKEAFEQEEKNS